MGSHVPDGPLTPPDDPLEPHIEALSAAGLDCCRHRLERLVPADLPLWWSSDRRRAEDAVAHVVRRALVICAACRDRIEGALQPEVTDA